MNEENISYYAVIPANVRYDAELTANAKLLYGEITALCNQKGFCWATNEYFAKLYGVSKWTVSTWISQLVKKGYVIIEMKYKEGTKLIEERRLRLPEPNTCYENPQHPIAENHNTLLGKSTIPYCEKSQYPIVKNRKENNTSNNTINNTTNNNTSNSDEFEHLWSIYPRKQGKKAAYEAYLRAVKKGCTNEEIEAGILRYNEHIQRNKTATKYIKQGSTYFRNESWNDVFEDDDTRGVIDEYGRLNFSKQYWDDSDPTVF